MFRLIKLLLFLKALKMFIKCVYDSLDCVYLHELTVLKRQEKSEPKPVEKLEGGFGFNSDYSAEIGFFDNCKVNQTS